MAWLGRARRRRRRRRRVDGGAAEWAGARGGAGLEPGERAGPVEAVAAGEMGQDVAGGELVQAHGALRLLRRVPPQPAPPHQPPHHPFPRVHLPLHPHRRRRRRSPAPSAAAGGASVQLDASRAVMPLDDGFPLAPQLLVQPLLRLPGIAVQRPPMDELHHTTPLLAGMIRGGAATCLTTTMPGRVHAERRPPRTSASRRRIRPSSPSLPEPPPPRALHPGQHRRHDHHRNRSCSPPPQTSPHQPQQQQQQEQPKQEEEGGGGGFS